MLVLSRKKNESIVINNDVVVTVVEIRGDKVRLGIVAPKDVPVHRQEVYDAIHASQAKTAAEAAAAPATPPVIVKPAEPPSEHV
jgi:carbon storage regulator